MSGADRYPAEAPGARRVAHVLLDSSLPQLDHLFDYAIPEDLAESLRAGQRVRVPFRSQTRRSHGYVIGFSEQSEFGGELQPIAEIVGPVPVLTPEVWRLARAVADRAAGSAGDILRLAIPQRMVRAEKQHLAQCTAASTRERSTGASEFAPSPGEHDTAARLMSGERLAVTPSHSPVRLSTGEWVGGWAEHLARIALTIYGAARSVIVVLPDYRDLDQLRDALDALGHHDTVRLDSRQPAAERYASFLRALEPAPCIIVGNRSAVYAPAHHLGAIVMWDDGDPVLAEPLSPYVHARDAALVRADLSERSAVELPIGLLFAAHARSAEVQRLIDIGYVQAERLLSKRTRVVHADAAVTPDVFAGRVPEFAARAIREGLRSGPVLVQVATPGYAPVAVCADCEELARCTQCAGPLAFRTASRVRCRWCGEYASNWRCRHCSGTRLEQRGMGSQRTVEQFERQFTGARIILSDGDHPHERVDSRPALVVATRGAEPLAAGGYRAVILLDAERLLAIESLRAGEDCMRWWLNAAALAAPDGVCVLASGGGPVVQALVTGRIEQWLHDELRDRRELRYPPAVRVASVTGGPQEVARALERLDDLTGVETLGPTPVATREAHEGLVRAIIRFTTAQGGEVAKRLRAALVADAAGASSRTTGRRPGRARPEALRLRFDDRGVFDG